MTLRPRRVVRPMTRLPRAIPMEPPGERVLPTLREFYEAYVDAERVKLQNNARSTDYIGRAAVVLPRIASGTYPVFVPSPALQANGHSDTLGGSTQYVLRRKPGVSMWPKTFDLRYDNLYSSLENLFGSDYSMSHSIHRPDVEYAYVQSVTIDAQTRSAGVRISTPIRITDDFKKKICREHVRHKIFALSTLLGRVDFFPISLPNVRLVWLLNAYFDRYKEFPKVVTERVNEYEKR